MSLPIPSMFFTLKSQVQQLLLSCGAGTSERRTFVTAVVRLGAETRQHGRIVMVSNPGRMSDEHIHRPVCACVGVDKQLVPQWVLINNYFVHEEGGGFNSRSIAPRIMSL